jgi:2-(1,2-epoxy-1,2-dihydrophenyl)acetyl-CoA isomerase
MTDRTVLFEARANVALITLNRPASLNSFTREMHHDLWAALDQAEADLAIRACVITGAGRGFCAGADLGWMKAAAEADFAANLDDARRLAALLRLLLLLILVPTAI